ncbi:MAG: hypothetical protein AAFX81_16455 [Pseudomonadota bacterium]
MPPVRLGSLLAEERDDERRDPHGRNGDYELWGRWSRRRWARYQAMLADPDHTAIAVEDPGFSNKVGIRTFGGYEAEFVGRLEDWELHHGDDGGVDPFQLAILLRMAAKLHVWPLREAICWPPPARALDRRRRSRRGR